MMWVNIAFSAINAAFCLAALRYFSLALQERDRRVAHDVAERIIRGVEQIRHERELGE